MIQFWSTFVWSLEMWSLFMGLTPFYPIFSWNFVWTAEASQLRQLRESEGEHKWWKNWPGSSAFIETPFLSLLQNKNVHPIFYSKGWSYVCVCSNVLQMFSLLNHWQYFCSNLSLFHPSTFINQYRSIVVQKKLLS